MASVLEGQVKGNISGEWCGVRTRHGTSFAVVIPRATCRCRILRNYEGPLRKNWVGVAGRKQISGAAEGDKRVIAAAQSGGVSQGG